MDAQADDCGLSVDCGGWVGSVACWGRGLGMSKRRAIKSHLRELDRQTTKFVESSINMTVPKPTLMPYTLATGPEEVKLPKFKSWIRDVG